MGPLTTYGYIDQGWSFIIIFAIGIAFGLILEQSGFSSSRKLAGVFYGYDFVVLKVFFSAGITAMAGLVLMGHYGLIDLNVIYINSNFLLSAVTGGVIMGFGFILGGFCPGTSVTGAVIGKIDAMIFIMGIFLGIFVFGAFYDSFKGLFSGYYFQGELISATLGLSKHLFVAMMIFMALAAFAVGAWFEKNATKGLKPTNQAYSGYFPEIMMVVFIAVFILFLPQSSPQIHSRTAEKNLLEILKSPESIISADEFAYRLINDPLSLNIIDIREEAAFQAFHFPGSANFSIDLLQHKAYREMLEVPDRQTVLISTGGVEAAKAQVMAYRMGYSGVRVLEGGLNGLVESIFYDNEMPEGNTDYSITHKYRFRREAAAIFGNDTTSKKLIIHEVPRATPKVTEISSAGGC